MGFIDSLKIAASFHIFFFNIWSEVFKIHLLMNNSGLLFDIESFDDNAPILLPEKLMYFPVFFLSARKIPIFLLMSVKRPVTRSGLCSFLLAQ